MKNKKLINLLNQLKLLINFKNENTRIKYNKKEEIKNYYL